MERALHGLCGFERNNRFFHRTADRRIFAGLLPLPSAVCLGNYFSPGVRGSDRIRPMGGGPTGVNEAQRLRGWQTTKRYLIINLVKGLASQAIAGHFSIIIKEEKSFDYPECYSSLFRKKTFAD
jgi:hypothetical protein